MRKVELRRAVRVFAVGLLTTTAALSLASITGGCAPKSEVVPSAGLRAPTSAEQVKIYEKAPRKYEQLGVIVQEVSPDNRWDERGDATRGFDQLKAKAAAKGANGLLLVDPDATEKHSVLAGYKGDYYTVPIRLSEPRAGVAQAIFVIEEK
ncbi:MAG: hypothetical protein WBD40_24775 [Tepidisphaeraceae bacterium]